MFMLRFLGLIASVLLIAPCKGEDVPYHYFRCGKNIDAICSDRIPNTDQQKLVWAVRLEKGKRRYKCPALLTSFCCWQGKFDINGHHGELTVPRDATFDPCTQV
ncbi:hypothetical protein Pst134EA_004736 [Puccinia striiformis f. sp. tritici]|uniref:hypothetical protein n=1 Tax=Puccinia striiformis f. sp. tritici TaxID=168172 RepID=UPI000A128015|nr:hypothetical protein Pst134EA_004736 [Puccinia striiformis f. sp. tritici]KAH9461894.1 hypothetical protein Pst134EB_005811 [Puccinia striiformis f. sp. tritici]KAH9470817.1 hypothetical protein Pst134EA_004736 [Puccinia striiformis f. sp. tritici]KAI9623102.1 hypothetical protein KEM48_009722 [Puccinia striiformis f. sp. tritici PST-130]